MKVPKYFTPDQWADISDEEKDMLNKKMTDFSAMQTLGLSPPLPDFVVEWTAKAKAAAAKTEPAEQGKGEGKTAPSATATAQTGQKRKPEDAASQGDDGKRVMLEREVQAAANLIKITDERCNASGPQRLIKMCSQVIGQLADGHLTSRFQVQDSTLERLRSALEAYCQEAGLEASGREDAVDGEQVAAVASASGGRRQRANAARDTAQAQERDALEPRSPRQEMSIIGEDPELPDEVLYLYCRQCQRENPGVCRIHKLQFVDESHVPPAELEAWRRGLLAASEAAYVAWLKL